MIFEDQEITAWKKYRGGLVLAGKIDLVVQMNRNGQNLHSWRIVLLLARPVGGL
jgi:hypothetical protein